MDIFEGGGGVPKEERRGGAKSLVKGKGNTGTR